MSALDANWCAARRRRLLDRLQDEQVDAALVTDYRDVYYLTGTLLPADLPVLCLVDNAEKVTLAGPADFETDAVDLYLPYEWNERGTRHPDPVHRLAEVAREVLAATRSAGIGVQQATLLDVVRRLLPNGSTTRPIDPLLTDLQSRKDPDEVEVIRASIRANLGAYAAASDAIQPGVSELEVLAAGMRGAMTAAGEKVFHDGDYQCGEYNGPARNRAIQAGELYIIDAWTCYRGYWADMARTFVVGQPPSEVQQALFDHIRWIQTEIPQMLRPGAEGIEIFQALDEMIRAHPPLADEGLIHHGGHAIGVRAHEMPDLNPNRGGRLEPGNVLCVEPGGYFQAARHGVRLENMYLITDNGCEDLCPGTVELVQCG